MQGNPHEHHEVEHLDADAVCEACGNVNPEGTLLCKTCGNNLRDQRARRLKAGPVAAAEPKVNIFNILRGVVIVFGICAVLWVALNVSTIESWLLSGVQSAEASGETVVAPQTFWDGPGVGRYEELAATLSEQAVTIEEAGMVPPGMPLASLDGRYVLKRSTQSAASPLGSAIVRVDGDTAYFVALLAGGTQIRGSAQRTSDTMFQALNIGVLHSDGSFADAAGYGQIRSTGEINCSGFFGEYETQADVVAIPLPGNGVPAPAPADDAPAPAEGAAPAEEGASTEGAPAAQ
ncbi:MAG: hypothetical protein HUU46_10220 [Candidatus Hydrogenedentes bacterium]|nr:hypothetical protein [Candidatus Hydrogenedentota bacterium]